MENKRIGFHTATVTNCSLKTLLKCKADITE